MPDQYRLPGQTQQSKGLKTLCGSPSVTDAGARGSARLTPESPRAMPAGFFYLSGCPTVNYWRDWHQPRGHRGEPVLLGDTARRAGRDPSVRSRMGLTIQTWRRSWMEALGAQQRRGQNSGSTSV